MFLKSLEMQGFKSFPDKTVVRFNKGLTAIVGPNGSGKSNLSDAMRWVLGEQSTKTLRGEKMEDVIFLGTSTRKAQGFAAVSLTFDNADRFLSVDADEVTITRRYYRSGESEYQINGKDVRLRDINELFMDTGLGRDGYSMIGQGKIAEIVNARPGQRREIFEEAAGISKYRYRKIEAERKLTAAEENLVRLFDILSELEGRVEPLRVQSEKARQFLKLSEQKKLMEVSLWMLALEDLRKSMQEQQNKYLIAKGDDEQMAREISGTEEKIQNAYARMQKCLTDGEECQTLRQNLQARIAQLKQDEAVHKNDIQHHQENIERLKGELSALQSDDESRKTEISGLEQKKKEAEEKTELLTASIAESREKLAGLSQKQSGYTVQMQEANQKANQIALDISRSNMLILTGQNAEADEKQRLETLKQELLSLEIRQQTEEETAAGIEELLTEIAARQEELENTRKGFELKQTSRTAKLEEARQEQQKLELSIRGKLQKAKLLEDLEQNMEGFQYSVKAVMKAARNGVLRHVHGTVAQLLTVEPAYTAAVETALGGALQNIIVEDAAAAKSGIRYLASQKAGRATFLPVSEMKGSLLREPSLARENGFVAIAAELVQYEEQYGGIVRSLLGRIAVAEDLDAASDIARKYGYKFRVVTLDGQQINVGGSFTGGSASKNQGILSRKQEISALKAEAQKITAQKEQAAEHCQKIAAEISALHAQIEGVRAEQLTAREDQIRFEGDKKRCEQNALQMKERRTELQKQQQESTAKKTQNQNQIAEAQKELIRLDGEAKKIQEQLTAFQGSQDTLADQRSALMDEIAILGREEISSQKDVENLERKIADLQNIRRSGGTRRERISADLKQLETACRTLSDSITSMQTESEQSAVKVTEYEAKSRAYVVLRQQIEGETTRLRQEERESSAKKEKTAAELARLEEQKLVLQKDYDQIIRQLMDEYELTRTEAKSIAVPLADPAASRQELASLKNRIRGLGSVNLGAIDEYQEVKERYDFLKAQVDDASASKAELERLIRQLTSDMEQMFRDSFAQINRHFGAIFAELFGGGHAQLVLTDPEDVLSSGVDITVQPPGKIIKNLEALSGGEQAFIAIAIYFAILKVRPSPFCVLDEIEAALDDVNVVKYANYLRMMSSKTQFILITHRRGSMEEADVLYGVTMQEQGVSKLLELQVSEISARMMAEMEQ